MTFTEIIQRGSGGIMQEWGTVWKLLVSTMVSVASVPMAGYALDGVIDDKTLPFQIGIVLFFACFTIVLLDRFLKQNRDMNREWQRFIKDHDLANNQALEKAVDKMTEAVSKMNVMTERCRNSRKKK